MRLFKNLYILVVFVHVCLLSEIQAQNSWTQNLPGIGTFSSPRASDLNSDGIKDIIIGAGRAEFESSDSAVLALDGQNGKLIWTIPARDQIFATPGLIDINQDGISDVIIGGRSAELKAIDGKSGKIIWEFYTPVKDKIAADEGWFNFYNPQFIPDQNKDGVKDILISNGGDVRVEPYDPKRPAGSLLVISSKDGSLLAKAQMPDNKEIYMSVIIQPMADQDDFQIVFGTGGETLGGSLYTCKLSDVLLEDLSNAKLLASSKDKGFISPPVWADLNKDKVYDIIAMGVDGQVYAFDGKSLDLIWQQLLPDTEAYSSLAVGYFTDDNIPDLFASVAKGEWPKLEWNRQFMLNGKNGDIEFIDSLGFYQTSSAVVADLTQNGRDEVMISINYQVLDTISRKTFKNMLMAINFKSGKVINLGAYFEGNNISSTPWIGDLDKNGKLDIVYVHSTNSYQTYTFDGLMIHRIDTDIPMPKSLNWGAYMGSNGDACFPFYNSNP